MKSILSPIRAKGRQREPPSSSPFSNLAASPIAARRCTLEERRRPAAKFTEGLSHGSPGPEEEPSEDDEATQLSDDDGEESDSAGERSPLLPIFSAEHLDSLPVYNITHTLRLLIVLRCETTLTWDQLRSPQISQFLVKPIQQQIRSSHFSKATIYALMSNCLQFSKEIQTNPGNSGVSNTRALMSELLAIRLLKEFSTRELGLPTGESGLAPGPNWDQSQRAKAQPRAARISTLEIAIRAQAKRFLAHPLVVQQLEAIWAGTIVFHHAADTLHRAPVKVTPNQNRGYGGFRSNIPILQASEDSLQPAKQREHRSPTEFAVRRSVTLYDPRQASLFKLSRLRVPRYRQFLSTCSFAVLLGLYVAVLVQRSLSISALELLFWFWSAGFLLDEIVGFNEQGFSLYIMSFWNTFDLGILFLLVCYYCMRLYGIIMPDGRKDDVADLAYDFLAANGVLLFPRLFSVLDHYRYFSQLLIAFRMMAMNLVAVFILIIISCSGFFVAFTLSFGKGNGYDASSVAYALFQILMGFTPAAWEIWPTYNPLGKTIMTIFLILCHFLIITILITVLTNSFMAIVQNANEEHQFLLAVNTISMVKSDALFSYVAPTNVIAWLLTPSRFILPFRQYVRINRTVIKATHFPILFVIYAYERMLLQGTLFESTDLVQHRGRPGPSIRALDGAAGGLNLFSPKKGRVREPSVATFHKDKALEEVFRRPFRDETIRDTHTNQKQRNTSNVVKDWMSSMDPNGSVAAPVEQDQSILDRLEARRVVHRRSQMAMRKRQGESTRDFTEAATMSIVSDPEEFLSHGPTRLPRFSSRPSIRPMPLGKAGIPETDADGDDELLTNEEEDLITLDPRSTSRPELNRQASSRQNVKENLPKNLITPPHVTRFYSALTPSSHIESSSPKPSKLAAKPGNPPRQNRHHNRMPSTATVVYDPPAPRTSSSSSSTSQNVVFRSGKNTGTVTPVKLSTSSGRHTPKRITKATARPIMPPRSAFQSAPDLAGMISLTGHGRGIRGGRHSSLTAFEIGSDIGDNKAIGGGFANTGFVPASFATQLEHAKAGMKARKAAQKQEEQEDQDRISKLVLARMNTLEEGFREVIREVQSLRKGGINVEEKTSQACPSRTGSKKGRSQIRKGNAKISKGTDDSEGLAFEMEHSEEHK